MMNKLECPFCGCQGVCNSIYDGCISKKHTNNVGVATHMKLIERLTLCKPTPPEITKVINDNIWDIM